MKELRRLEMDYIKIKVDEAKYLEIRDFYDAKEINDPKRPYDLFDIKTINNIFVKAYKSKKQYTILFAGDASKIELEASIFCKYAHLLEKKNTSREEKWEDNNEQIGSDEVGVGDFFLGFYVVASYLSKEDMSLVEELNIMDSKKMTDSKILEVGPILRKKIKHHLVNISPTKLSELEDKKWSTHKILANAHNLAHERLIKMYNIPSSIHIYIDQFEKEEIYKHYLLNNKVTNSLTFQTKGESYYPSIAVSSVIARYVFLTDWQKMEEDLGMTIPKGASKEVDKTYITLVKKYGQERIDPYVKKFFRNYKINE